MLHCNAGVFYTGHTDNLETRIAQHKTGAIKVFSSRFLPVELVWSQEFVTRDEAKAAEKQIKGWSRAKKLALIRGDWEEISRLAKGKGSPSTSSGQTDLVLARQLLEGFRQQASAAHPREACGLLLGKEAQITAILPAENVHPAPRTHFTIDPQTLINAHREARSGGLQVLGYYHSHPHGRAEPSATDRAHASGDGRIWAIVAGEEIAFWRDGPQGFISLSYCVAAT